MLGLGDMPGLSEGFGLMMAEAAAVCLDTNSHSAGVTLKLVTNIGKDHPTYQLEWTPVDEQKRLSYADMQEATEYGACGLAILMARNLTGKVVLLRSKKGQGFDYWIGEPSNDDGLFEGKTRLEVSGILMGDETTIRARVRQKKNQIKPSDHIAPGCIAVIEFGNPLAHVEGS